MKVHEAMTRDVVSVKTDTPFRRLVEIVNERHVSGLPVVDEFGCVVGVVSSGDLVVKEHRASPVGSRPPVWPKGQDVHEFARRVEGCVAGELMTSPAVTVEEDADLRVAARLMSVHAVGRLPVTCEGKLTGVVTRGDVLKVFLRTDDEIRAEIVDVILPAKVMDDVSGLDVSVSDGVVTLSGKLKRRSTARVVAFHVDRVDGVTRVNNELSYEIDDIGSRRGRNPIPPTGPAEMVL